MSEEDRQVLRWIADAGRKGRSSYDHRPGHQTTDPEIRQRLMAAGLVWESRQRTSAAGDGVVRHVVSGLGLIALGTEGQS